ncbi:MAG TPA: hypothetical protein VFP26_14280 [Gemmatimonadaceae bacterium]|nr:hypothetical protein [Gemmatimonadaceae bacterium]
MSSTDLDARRLFLTATSVLWGNATFDDELGMGRSSDGNGYNVKNAQYAVALLDAVADQRDVGLDPAAAVTRANAILAKICGTRDANAKKPSTLRRHSGRAAPALTPGSGADELLATLLYLSKHHDRLQVRKDVVASINLRLNELVDLHAARVARISAKAGRPGSIPTPRSAEEWQAALDRAFGSAAHWADAIVSDVSEFLEQKSFAWPIPLGRGGGPHLSNCDLQPCKRILCYVHGYIPTLFFKGEIHGPPESHRPVVMVSGWQVQITVHTGGGTFGDESSFSTRPPASAPWGDNSNQVLPPPVAEFEPRLPIYREYYGLGTMLRCAAGYDYVTWGQSHPGGPIQDSVNELRFVINETKEKYGVEEVILVAHSRGGLVSRKCILDYWQNENAVDVQKLVTYGTPHLGAALATVGEDILAEAIPGLLLAVVFASPSYGELPAQMLDFIGQIFGPSVKTHLENLILTAVTPVVEQVWPNFAGFVASGEEMRPDSSFIQNLNAGYAGAQVPVKGQLLSLWEAIDTVLIAGTAPDQLTVYLGSWLASLDMQGLLESLTPHAGTTVITVLGMKITVPWIYYSWHWHWLRLAGLVSDIIPLFPELDALDTFKQGLGDSVVERSSAIAEGVVGVRRAEFGLHHFNIKSNNDTQAIYQSPVGIRSVYPWQLLFLELGLDAAHALARCSPVTSGCQNFDMAKALS